MNTVYTLLSSSSTTTNIPPRTFKGMVSLTYQLSSINVGTKIPLRMEFNTNLGDSYVFSDVREFNFESSVSILLKPYTHTYNYINLNGVAINSYYTTIKITYSDFTVYQYVIPINIYANSFYSEHKSLKVANSQFVDDSDNSLFISFDNGNGDVLHSIIK